MDINSRNQVPRHLKPLLRAPDYNGVFQNTWSQAPETTFRAAGVAEHGLVRATCRRQASGAGLAVGPLRPDAAGVATGAVLTAEGAAGATGAAGP
jgi:hypothetical protein